MATQYLPTPYSATPYGPYHYPYVSPYRNDSPTPPPFIPVSPPQPKPDQLLSNFPRTPGSSLSAHYNAILEQSRRELALLAAGSGIPWTATPVPVAGSYAYQYRTPAPSGRTDGSSVSTGISSLNVNIANLQNANFGGASSDMSAPPDSSTSSSSSTSPWQLAAPPFFAAAPLTGYPVPWAAPPPQPAHPKTVDHPSPFSSPSSANQPVLTVQQFLRSNSEIKLNVNPWIAAVLSGGGGANTFPLIVDFKNMTTGELRVWKMPKAGGDKKNVEEWKDWDEPATLPKLNRLTLISPLIEGEVVVENSRGVTCGDVLISLHGYAQSALPPQHFHHHPFIGGQHHQSCQPPHVTRKKVDAWVDQTCFKGLRKDDRYIKERLGWADPACFVVNLGVSGGWLWRWP